jgi:hypothetical protein
MTITPLPTPPDPNDPATFNTRAANWVAALQTWTNQVNALPNMSTIGGFNSGTEATPSVTFNGDLDTGMWRPGADIVGFSTSGAERVRITNGGMQVTGQITGTAVTQSETDTTAGRLLRVGDFGIGVAGNAPTCADLDDTTLANGFYRTANDTTTAGTWPPSNPTGANRLGTLIVARPGTNNGQQIWLSIGEDSVWRRRHQGGTWGPWRRMTTILGTVSQSGGVATGAIIERGSNSNGEYVRFADGTQICTHAVSANLAIDTAFMGGFRSTAQTWTFPAAFFAAPVFTPVARNLTAFGAVSANVPGTTSATYAVTAVSSQSAATREVALHAIGRWF